MTKPKKKPKTGDVVGWGVIDGWGDISGPYETRAKARRIADNWNKANEAPKDRIFKIVLAK